LRPFIVNTARCSLCEPHQCHSASPSLDSPLFNPAADRLPSAIAQDLFDWEFERQIVPVEEYYQSGIQRARILGAYRAFDLLSLVCTRWKEASAYYSPIDGFWRTLIALAQSLYQNFGPD